MSYFCAKNVSWHINVKLWGNINKKREQFLFSYNVVKVWEVLLAYEGDHNVKIDQQLSKQQQRLKFFVSK